MNARRLVSQRVRHPVLLGIKVAKVQNNVTVHTVTIPRGVSVHREACCWSRE